MTLTDVQQRHIATTLAHVDHLLDDVERVMQDTPSPFARARLDIEADERRRLGAAVTDIRHRLAGALGRLDIPRPEPEQAASWTAETALQFADIALTELNARDLKGYGDIDAASMADIVRVVAELRGRLADALRVLHGEGPPGE